MKPRGPTRLNIFFFLKVYLELFDLKKNGLGIFSFILKCKPNFLVRYIMNIICWVKFQLKYLAVFIGIFSLKGLYMYFWIIFMKLWHCPICNGTLETLNWSKMWKILSLFPKSVSTTFPEKPQMKINILKKHSIYFILDQKKFSSVPLYIRHCHLCMEGQLKLRLQSL